MRRGGKGRLIRNEWPVLTRSAFREMRCGTSRQLSSFLRTKRFHSTQNPMARVMRTPMATGSAIFRRKSGIEVEKYSKDTEMHG